MGTRADFYIGRGEAAEWIGSIAFDGYPEGVDDAVLTAKTEADYRTAVKDFFATRDDATLPADGWPWPWNDSQTTDYSYAFDGGEVFKSLFGYFWWPANERFPSEDDNPEMYETEKTTFPNMEHLKRVAPIGSTKSGIGLFALRGAI